MMRTVLDESPIKPPRHLFGLSPWLIVGVSIILALVVMALTLRGSRREEEGMIQNYVGRGEALIWALEAGTRTWMGARGDGRLLQQLVSETAKQPGLVYVAVVDSAGMIVSHGDPEQVGRAFPIDLPAGWERGGEAPAWRIRDADNAKVLEVRRLFSPIQGDHHAFSEYQRGHGHSGMGRRRGRGMGEQGAESLKTFVFVGLDYQPLHDALSDDYYRSITSALLAAALGVGGFLSLFWAYGYKRSRRMLMDARALAGEVVTSLPLGLLTRDPDGRAGIVNAAALGLLGTTRERLAERPLRDVPGLDWDGLIRALPHDRRSLEKEDELVLDDGRRIPVSVAVSAITTEDGLSLGHLFLFRDVGEVKRLQAEVEKNRRLTALGNLAAGVAHEIRNPLSSIKGLATYLAQRAAPDGPEQGAANTMIEEVNRLNRVVSELLDFARPGSVKRDARDVNGIVAGALRLADADLRSKDIAVEFVPDPSLPSMAVNGERLTQALLNLILNAVQAMDKGGRLRIAVARDSVEGTLSIAVSDDGRGMTDEVRASIFTPYFTTKPSGTGLGLAIVHQIVEGHGGTVNVASSPGKGSSFTIVLPERSGAVARDIERTKGGE